MLQLTGCFFPGLRAEGLLDDIPDTTLDSKLILGPKPFIPDLPLDHNGNQVPVDAALEDQGYVDTAYESCLPLMLLCQHFLVDCVGTRRVETWKKRNPGEPIIEMFHYSDWAWTVLQLINFGHNNGWNKTGRAAGLFSSGKGVKRMWGQMILSSEGQAIFDKALTAFKATKGKNVSRLFLKVPSRQPLMSWSW